MAQATGPAAHVDDVVTPLTPLQILNGALPLVVSTSPPTAAPPVAASESSVCPTLLHALDTLPTLLLLHLLASRIAHFALPHQLWKLDWHAYEKELRGFAAGEEWTHEVGFEMAAELARRVASAGEGDKMAPKERDALATLAVAIRAKVGIECPEVSAGPLAKH